LRGRGVRRDCGGGDHRSGRGHHWSVQVRLDPGGGDGAAVALGSGQISGRSGIMNERSVRARVCGRVGVRSILGVASIACAVGCVGLEGLEEESRVADEGQTLLARVEMESGNVAEFWEQAPGVILVAEGGVYPTPPSLGVAAARAADTLELYDLLAPEGEEPPVALVEAVDRENLRRAGRMVAELAENSDAVARPRSRGGAARAPEQESFVAAVDTSACPWSWFDDQFSLVTQGPADDDSWSYEQRTGTTSYSNDRMSIVLAAACSYRGSITFDFWSKPTNQIVWQNSPSFTRTVHEGQWYWTLSRAEWWYEYARDIYSEVRNASGDGYHHKGVGCDRKAFSQCAVNAPDGEGYWGE
jgi:hypothetical protein